MTLHHDGQSPPAERQLTRDSLEKNLDNNINWSPDGRFLCFDCRPASGIGACDRIGVVDVKTGEVRVVYVQKPPVKGIGAASWLNDHELIAIHALTSGLPYDPTVRGGMIIVADGSGKTRWLDSRDVTPPFTPGALRGGTHKHEPDSSGQWVGFTYNDYWMKSHGGSDLRNVGMSKRGTHVPVHSNPKGENFEGESFSVLLTAAVPNPRPASDEYRRADGDCWVGRIGYPKGKGFQRARAFSGEVSVNEGGKTAYYREVFIVDVPEDITKPGPLGPLQGKETDYPKPPAGAIVRRLTRTAANSDPALRGISGHLRASGDGRWIAFLGESGGQAVRHSGSQATTPERPNARTPKRPKVLQVFAVSPVTGKTKQVSRIEDGVIGDPRFSPDSRFVVCALPDGSVGKWSAEERTWGQFETIASARVEPPTDLVISPDSCWVAYNRTVDGIKQIFITQASQ